MSDSAHDEKRALELIREALRNPEPVSLERAAELLLSSKINGEIIPPRVDAVWPWPMVRRVGRPRTKSRWHGAYWKNFGQARARESGAAQRRVAGGSLRIRLTAVLPELASLGMPRRFWAGVLARGIKGTTDDHWYLGRLAKAWGSYSRHAVRIAFKQSSLPLYPFGQSEDCIRRALKALESQPQ